MHMKTEPSPQFQAIADTVCQVLHAALPQAQAAWVFGSAASGRLHAGSDIDIAVMQEQRIGTDQHLALTEQLSSALQRDVDLIDFSRSTSVMHQQILTTGQRILCRDAFAVDSYEAFCLTEYLHFNARRQEQLRDVMQRGSVLSD
jgi:uncharacterized protein